MKTVILSSLVLAGGIAAASDLVWFNPGDPMIGNIAAPKRQVSLNVNPRQTVVRIPTRFYGINMHPSNAEEGFRNSELLRALKPDTVRVMLADRTTWIKENGRTTIKREPLYDEPGRERWDEVDALIDRIMDAGAEPLVTLGFGAPKYLNTAGGKKFGLPRTEDMAKYAELKIKIARHLAGKKFAGVYISLENEPENVKYPIEDYIRLHQLAVPEIRRALPGIGICGPTTGYAQWHQPGGGSLGFLESHEKLLRAGVDFDAADLHVYSGNPQNIFDSVTQLQKIYGGRKPIIFSELNLDWRYSGAGGDVSRQRNSSWASGIWLAAVFDGLQQLGVERAYYYCLRDNFFGLYDYWFNEVRPAFYVFWLFTNHLGRNRVAASSDSPAVKIIAAVNLNGHTTALVYNLSSGLVKLNLRGSAFQPREYLILSREWYDKNKAIDNGVAKLPEFSEVAAGRLPELPPEGFLILKE